MQHLGRERVRVLQSLGSVRFLVQMRLQIHQRGEQSQRVAELVKLLAKRFCERLESEHQRE